MMKKEKLIRFMRMMNFITWARTYRNEKTNIVFVKNYVV